jgi:hypothetical protein
MSVAAVVLAVLLAVPPSGAQSPVQEFREPGTTSTSSVVVPETLQQALSLMRQPGFHPELVELLAINVAQETELSDEPNSGGLKPWHVGLIIGLAVLAGVMIWYANGMANS